MLPKTHSIDDQILIRVNIEFDTLVETEYVSDIASYLSTHQTFNVIFSIHQTDL